MSEIIHVPHAPECQMMTSRWLLAPCTCGASAKFAQYLAERQSVCTCELVDVSTQAGPAFVRGESAGCRKHGKERDAAIAEAKRLAREA